VFMHQIPVICLEQSEARDGQSRTGNLLGPADPGEGVPWIRPGGSNRGWDSAQFHTVIANTSQPQSFTWWGQIFYHNSDQYGTQPGG
jgi:hypothetical protein